MNSLFKLLFWRQGNAVCWSMNAEHWICSLLFLVLVLQNHKDQRNLNSKVFYGSSVLKFNFSPQWSTAVLCVSTSQLFIVQGPSTFIENHPGIVLYSPVTVVCIYDHGRFASTGTSYVLVLFFLDLFCLPAEWECVFSVEFLVPSSCRGFGCPVTGTLQATSGAQALGRGALLYNSYWSKSQAWRFPPVLYQKTFFPQPVFSLHFPHLHIPLVLSLLLNFIRNNPSLGTNTLVWALFYLSLVG